MPESVELVGVTVHEVFLGLASSLVLFVDSLSVLIHRILCIRLTDIRECYAGLEG